MSLLLSLDDLEPDHLSEMVEAMQQFHQEGEVFAVQLEQSKDKAQLQKAIYFLFDGLRLKASHLGVVPLSEALSQCTELFKKIYDWNYYSPSIVDLILALIDRLLLLVTDIAEKRAICGYEIQQTLIPLQKLLEANSAHDLDIYLSEAVRQMKGEDSTADHSDDILLFDDDLEASAADRSDDIVLFDDDLETNAADPSDDIVLFDDEDIEDNTASSDNVVNDSESTTTSKAALCSLNLKSVNPLLEARDCIEILNLNNPNIRLLSGISDKVTNDIGSHTNSILEIVLSLNIMMGKAFSEEDLFIAVSLHDIGLAPLIRPAHADNHSSKYEHSIVREHPQASAQMVAQFTVTSDSHEIVLHHHERRDGSGYPAGLTGNNINDGAILLGIADAFDEIISHRSYDRLASSISKGISETSNIADEQIDRFQVKSFMKFIGDFWLPDIKVRETRVH